MANILVTGGAGFMGSHVVDDLIDAGHDVFVIDDLSGGFEININKKAIFINGSIEDYLLINKLFEDYKFEYVYHLAAYAAEGLSHFIRRFNYNNNLIGSVNLINASIIHEVKCFIFTSSIAVYGEGQLPMTEFTPPKPEDPYGIAKYAVELDLFSANKMYNLNYIIFRPHNVYGHDMGNEHVIPEFIERIKSKTNIFKIKGTGNETRSFIYITDFVKAFDIILRKGKHCEIYNIGTEEEINIKTLAKKIAKIYKKKIFIKKMSLAKGGTQRRCPDISKIKKLGFVQKISLENGIKLLLSQHKR